MPTCILKNSIITEASIILYTRWDPFSIVQAHEGRGAHSSLDRGGMRRVSVAIVMESLDRHRLVTVIGLAEVDRRGNVDSVIDVALGNGQRQRVCHCGRGSGCCCKCERWGSPGGYILLAQGQTRSEQPTKHQQHIALGDDVEALPRARTDVLGTAFLGVAVAVVPPWCCTRFWASCRRPW